MTMRSDGQRLGALALTLALALAPPATLAGARAQQANGPQKITSVEGITEYKLANGLRVLLFPDPSQSKVTVNLTVFVGSRHEGYGEAGMAHLLEHMVFKGTPKHPDIVGDLKEKGAQFNGTTWVDRTNYFETLPASDANLEYAIAMEADRMINSPIKAEDLATEFSVVRNEFESGENSPSRVLSQRMMAAAYEWHNYGKSTIGNRADIEKVPADNLRAFYRKYYQPDNAMLVVAGKFDEAKALEFVSKHFGSIPKPERALPVTYTEEPAQDGERTVSLRRVGDVGIVGMLFHVPAASHPEFPAVKVLASILGTEPSGRLYKALVETRKATDVGSAALPTRDPGVLEVEAEVNTRDPQVLESVRDEIVKVLETVAKDGVTADEVDRARRQFLKNRELAQADPNRIAVELSEWGAQGDWRLYFLDRDRLEKVTPEQVQEAAKKYLTASNRTVGIFIPSDAPSRTPVPATPEIASLVDGYTGRSAASAGEEFDATPLAIEARVQKPAPIEGVKVALLPKKTRNEAVNLVLRLDYGNAENLKGLTEAASVLGPLMARATKTLDRQQLQDALDKNFARLSVGGRGGSGAGSLTVSLQTKRENLPQALELMRQVLREPALDESEFETIKAQRLAALEQGKSEPTTLGATRLQRQIAQYPPDDVRYVPTVEESIARARGVTIDQVRTLYRDYLGAGHGELAIVGDFDASEVLPEVETMLKGWKASKPYARIERSYQPNLPVASEAILTPDKANAIYLAGLTLPMNEDDPDYPALEVANFLFGGGALSSRLGDRLRQKDGLSYGAGSMFAAPAPDNRGILMINAIYNPKNVTKVKAGVVEEFDRLLKDGVTQAELDRAKAGLLQQRRIGRTSDPSLAGALVSQLYLGKTMKDDAARDAKIEALTVDAVNAAIRKHLDPKKLSVITAGDFEKKDEAKPEAK